ncbi:MAG: paraquat-inducible membrane protein A [Thiothrix nivea]|nr:MAG: paraquat-inducible membrane protein A [Thiothrix nivea]
MLLALLAFREGVFAPLMELEKLWVFNNQYSLYSGLQTLWEHDEIFLFWFLFLFSVMTPLVKMTGLVLIANTDKPFRKAHERFLYILETWGKWSMLDVFVVALLFVSVKLGSLANVTVHEGLYWFGGAVILIQGLSVWLSREVKKNHS